MDINVRQIIERSMSSNQLELSSAREDLGKGLSNYYALVVSELSEILANTDLTAAMRMQAGLQLKNAIHSNHSGWLSLVLKTQETIKTNCLGALATQDVEFRSAAQCVAAIACAEIPNGQWINVIRLLVDNVIDDDGIFTQFLKRASLETLEYICSDIKSRDFLVRQSDAILAAVAVALKNNQSNDIRVRRSAAKTLLNSLDFCVNNFRDKYERSCIMEIVCKCTQSSDLDLCVIGLQCLVKIVSLYYVYMEPYMTKVLFKITVEAMISAVDPIVVQAIEFWSTVCEEEIQIQMDRADAKLRSVPETGELMFYGHGAVKFLVPILLGVLERQFRFVGKHDWTPHKAAGVCLTLLSLVSREDIVGLVVPYVLSFIRHPDWKRRDAALMALGSILEGPSSQSLESSVVATMPVITELLADPISVVQETAAWVVRRVCKILPEVPLDDNCLSTLVLALVRALNCQDTRVSTNVCRAVSSLAEGAHNVEKKTNADSVKGSCQLETNKLSPYFAQLIDELLKTADRADFAQSNLRNASYDALIDLIRSGPRDCYECIQRTTTVVLTKLDNTLQADSTSAMSLRLATEHQSLLCAALRSGLHRLDQSDAEAMAETVMGVLMVIFEQGPHYRCDRSTVDRTWATCVKADALMTIGALIGATSCCNGSSFLENRFPQFMDVLMSFLEYHGNKDDKNVNQEEDHETCSCAITILGDLTRSSASALGPYIDRLFEVLFTILRNPTAHQSLRPKIISTFGDFLLLPGDHVTESRIAQVLEEVQDACQFDVDFSELDMVRYLNVLRKSCVETFVALVQRAKGNVDRINFLASSLLEFIVNLLEHIAMVSVSSVELLGSCCGLVGDIAVVFGKDSLRYLDTDAIGTLLRRGRGLKDGSTEKKWALWAIKKMAKLGVQHSGRLLNVLSGW